VHDSRRDVVCFFSSPGGAAHHGILIFLRFHFGGIGVREHNPYVRPSC
jgi:hypothetical protein